MPAQQLAHAGCAVEAVSAGSEARAPTPHRAVVLDGRAYAAQWQVEISQRLAAVREANAGVRPPGLAVLLVGDQADSHLYVRRKREACAAVGINFSLCHLRKAATQEEVESKVRAMAADPDIHGVLVQLPLPRHIAEEPVLEAVGVDKDVDGFHPLNAGRLALRGWQPTFVPCTPKGCIELLRRAGLPVLGKTAVVMGNSNTVGMPLAMLLRDCGASTVTVCNDVKRSGSGLADVTRTADILVAAFGRAELVRRSWVKPGAVVIDVGINPSPLPHAQQRPVNGDECNGEPPSWLHNGDYRVVGDVAFDELLDHAGAITPVPGGVGPMTIAALLDNMLQAWMRLEHVGA